jgi:dienelactone hydrolase
MHQETVSIDGPRDFELDRDRSHPLTFTVTWPDASPAPGLVVVIGGCGGQAESAEGRHRRAREHIVTHCGLAAVSVDYHAQQNRPFNGGAVNINPAEHLQLIGRVTLAGVRVPDLTDLDALSRALGQIGVTYSARATIRPGHDELQNFGVLQAMDHLAVIGHLLERRPSFDATQIFALGGSHGGYISHMMTKMAPGVLAGVVDNSGYVQPPVSYLGFGDQAEYVADFNGVSLKCQVEGAWSFNNRSDPTFYDRNRDLIRDIAYPPHMQIMARAAADGATAVSMIHCGIDELTPPGDKVRQAARLRALGIANKLHMVQREEVDGVIFKEYTHALAASLKRLFVRDLPWLRAAGARGSGGWGGAVDYPCVDRGYRFNLLGRAPYVTGEVFELFSDDADAPAHLLALG